MHGAYKFWMFEERHLPEESRYLQFELLLHKLRLFREFHHQFQAHLKNMKENRQECYLEG